MVSLKVSIVIPTYNERENIVQLIEEIANHMRNYEYEIIVVDDNSPDGTADLAESISNKYPVRVVRRPGKLGLTSAIYDGVKVSTGDVIVVMDADLQHPPSVLPGMLEKTKECDLVIASRYTKGGGVENWSIIRRIISSGAILLARLVIAQARNIKDPVSGFFAVRKKTVEKWSPIAPRGYKALLEILATTNPREVCEVPYIFKGRARGKSKLGSKQILSYVAVLARLNPIRLLLIVTLGIMLLMLLVATTLFVIL